MPKTLQKKKFARLSEFNKIAGFTHGIWKQTISTCYQWTIAYYILRKLSFTMKAEVIKYFDINLTKHEQYLYAEITKCWWKKLKKI